MVSHLPGVGKLVISSFIILVCLQVVGAYICQDSSDQYVSDVSQSFWTLDWIKRGKCIRSNGDSQQCSQTLKTVIDNLDQLRWQNYLAAAHALSLIPAIGALAGTPTVEIWRLLNLFPFGGALTMLLSFGGTLFSTNVYEYEQATTQQNLSIGAISQVPRAKRFQFHTEIKLEQLEVAVGNGINRPGSRDSRRTSRLYSRCALATLGMLILVIISQFCMAAVEQSGVILWWW